MDWWSEYKARLVVLVAAAGVGLVLVASQSMAEHLALLALLVMLAAILLQLKTAIHPSSSPSGSKVGSAQPGAWSPRTDQ